MASIRPGRRKDGSKYWSVLYRLDGKQPSESFNNEKDAERLKALMNSIGPGPALDAFGLRRPVPAGGLTVGDWLDRYIKTRTGVEQYTLDKYNQYAADIKPILGDIQLPDLTEEDIARWVRHLETTNSRRGRPRAPKTIKNMHGFLSAALATAVPRHIPANPAAGRRLPRTTADEPVDELDVEDRMLSRDEFDRLLAATTDYWKPLLEFLVAAGCRWGEAVALKPRDINREEGTVRIRRATKYSSAGYQTGPTKTVRSDRKINVDKAILDKLDYSHEYLFVNRDGGPVRYAGFRRRVWDPAVERARLEPKPTPHALRHTCASWLLSAGMPMLAVSRHLGHKSALMTADVYGGVDRRVSEQVAAVMGGLLAREPQKAIEA